MTVRRRRREVLHRRIRIAVAVTIGYNVLEAVVAITAGTAARSAALTSVGMILEDDLEAGDHRH